MNIQVSATPDGFPRVIWEQRVPTGETALSLNRKRKVRRAILASIFLIALMAGAGANLTAITIVVVVYALFAGLFSDRGVKFRVLDMVITRYSDEGPHAQHNTAIRQHRSQLCAAEVRVDRPAKTLRFVAYSLDPPPGKVYTDVPLLSFDALTRTSDLEWFYPAGNRDMARIIGAPETPALVAHPRGHPPTREDYDLLLEIDDTDDFQTEIRTLVRERSPRPQQEPV